MGWAILFCPTVGNVMDSEEMPKEVVPLMHECWSLDPNNRPSFKEIRERLEGIRRDLTDGADVVPPVFEPTEYQS